MTSLLTAEDVDLILKSFALKGQKGLQSKSVEDFVVNAGDKTLGLLGEYWKLKVNLCSSNQENEILHFFIKTIPRTNEAKAAMIQDINIFNQEITFYTDIKMKLNLPGLKPWCPEFIAALDDAIILQDLNVSGYRVNNRFTRFDEAHALQGLQTLARMHASTIVLEEIRKAELNRPYFLTEDYEVISNPGGFIDTDVWFTQCRAGALEAIKAFSKYGQTDWLQKIKDPWENVWIEALNISGCSKEYRNVMCHRDLWNNNILFHYKVGLGENEPDDCVLVDFQNIRYQPPSCDVMLFLYCNLNPKLREENMDTYLNYYYAELESRLQEHGINIIDVISKESFMKSAAQQRLWGLIAFACFAPNIFADDDATARICTDAGEFYQVMNKDKGGFIKAMMEKNIAYRNIMLETFEEIIERYCL